MSGYLNIAVLCLLGSGASCLLHAQFTVLGRPIQIHGFGSQGFALSDQNNYLTMHTSTGSLQFTDGGLNVTMQVTSKLRVGAQVYVRDVGALGRWHPLLDWAVVDYKFTDWFGAQGGKVKTVFGLYNDSQDMESLHTWAIMPQSLYPLDLRSSTVAHLGGDLYGEIPLPKHLGSVAYTTYAGRRFDDRYGGYRFVTLQSGSLTDRITGWMAGADLRWNNLKPGLTLGASYLGLPAKGYGTYLANNAPYQFEVDSRSSVAYVDYQRGNLHLNAEYTRVAITGSFTGIPGISSYSGDSRGWYAAVAYRIRPKLELGTYHSLFISEASAPSADPANHIRDQVFTVRFDINRHLNFKVEGHLIDGFGSVTSARGFYLRQNPDGFSRKTNLGVLRIGYTF